MNHVLTCSCGEVIVKCFANDTKIRNKILVVKGGVIFAVCKRCNAEVRVPLTVDTALMKSMTAPEKPRRVPLYIKNVYRDPKFS